MGWTMVFAKPQPERRIKSLLISYEMFIHLITPDGHHLVRQRGIPDDARLLAVSDEPAMAGIQFILESETFESVEPGITCPRLFVDYEEIEMEAVPA